MIRRAYSGFIFIMLTIALILVIPGSLANTRALGTNETQNFIVHNQVRLVIIYLYSANPTPGNWSIYSAWAFNRDGPYPGTRPLRYGGSFSSDGMSVVHFFQKYVRYDWQVDHYQFRLSNMSKDYTVAISQWRDQYGGAADFLLYYHDAVVFWMGPPVSSVCGMDSGTVVCSAQGTLDGIIPLSHNLDMVRFTYAHELTHTFGAGDHFTGTHGEIVTNDIMGDGRWGASTDPKMAPYLNLTVTLREVHWDWNLKENWHIGKAPPSCPVGDVTPDGIVNIQDLVLAASSFGSKAGDPSFNPAADLDHDGIINLADLRALASILGQTCSSYLAP